MPYHLTARPPASDEEVRQVRKLAQSHHARQIGSFTLRLLSSVGPDSKLGPSPKLCIATRKPSVSAYTPTISEGSMGSVWLREAGANPVSPKTNAVG